MRFLIRKRWFFLFCGLLLFFLCGCKGRQISPIPGIYPVKLKALSFFDLLSRDFNPGSAMGKLVGSKPDAVTLQFSDKKLDHLEFGFFQLGNNNTKVWFAMGRDLAGYWTDFYVDQNLDFQITEKEKVTGFQTHDGTFKKFRTKEAFALVPVPLLISYKGTTGEYRKLMYFFISVVDVRGKNSTETESVVEIYTASILEGRVQIRVKNELQWVGFRIVDNNGNGCFDDFSKDLIYIDSNNDGYLKAKESQALFEFFTVKLSKKEKKQYQVIVLPNPQKIAVFEGIKNYDVGDLEGSMKQ